MNPKEVGMLISCQTGSVRTSKHFAAAGMKDTAKCELCGREDEDEIHMLWKCDATKEDRQKHWPKPPPRVGRLAGLCEEPRHMPAPPGQGQAEGMLLRLGHRH